jgi:Helix-turn-helix of DDE superfamily endonuclease
LRNDRQAKALTGCSVAELEELLPVFEQFLALLYQTLKSTRQRGLGGGSLPLLSDKLIAVLMYLKTYPTYDVFSLVLNLDRTRCFQWIHILLPLLEASLGRKITSSTVPRTYL